MPVILGLLVFSGILLLVLGVTSCGRRAAGSAPASSGTLRPDRCGLVVWDRLASRRASASSWVRASPWLA